MGLRFGIARTVAAVSRWGLVNVFHRPAANFPGKIALYADPRLVADLRGNVADSICVVGTNGKTTVTNLLADAFEEAGHSVVCNRTGANLDSGVTTALLGGQGEWGIFECDELWLARILPGLQSRYVVLLNLFRDQLDRVGEIDHIQESIAAALAQSPGSVLVYNCDDPLCQAIADRVDNVKVPFGIASDLGLEQNTVADARMCQRCSTMLEYEWRQYGQLGSYRCPSCGFSRPYPIFAAERVELGERGSSFTMRSWLPEDGKNAETKLHTHLAGTYMVYNMLAIASVCNLAGVGGDALQRAADSFDPKNGRLQAYDIGGRSVLLNLAKNPTGFNQNLEIVLEGEGPKAVAFYINDKEADGRDVSWLWDIDFQKLARAAQVGELQVFAGGIRRNDMQVRLKYAGVASQLVDGADDFLARVGEGTRAYVIANYTALPGVKATLDRLAEESEALAAKLDQADALRGVPTGDGQGDVPAEDVLRGARSGVDSRDVLRKGACSGVDSRGVLRRDAHQGVRPLPAEYNTDELLSGAPNASIEGRRLVIAHLYPTLLNLYGDGGNVTVLAERAKRRGIGVEVVQVDAGDDIDFDTVDIVYLGGGPDREQHLAAESLAVHADGFRSYVADDGVVLAICGGFQILGREWLMGDESVQGLGVLGATTKRAKGGSHNRIVGNIALESPLASTMPVVGYENHAGRTFLEDGVEPFGRVRGAHGRGNNDSDRVDGACCRNVIGTYLHGPLLAKNPEVADELLSRALARRYGNGSLVSLDDAEERAANAFMAQRS